MFTNPDEFAEQAPAAPADFVIPEDLSTLSDEDLTALHATAVESFDALYGDGKNLATDAVEALSALTEGIEALTAEIGVRQTAAAERDEAAAELARRVGLSSDEDSEDDDEDEDDEDDESLASDPAESAAEETPVVDEVVASGRKEIRVNLGSLASRKRPSVRTDDTPAERTMRDVMLAADVPGFSAGTGMDWQDVGKAVDRRLAGFNPGQYANAAKAKRHLREQLSVAVIRKPFDDDLVVRNTDPGHVDEVIRNAVNEKRLPGGSLVASGGWCAPSETIYDLFEIESRDGLFSLPEVGVARGGIQFTPGPDFSSIFTNADLGFHYTEAEDEAGDYDGAGGGTKPCYHVPCPPSFAESRLDLVGLCITAGLLQQRGYPEMIARTARGALVAHDHKLAGRVVSAVEDGSTAVSVTSTQGAAAPLLAAIELQVEHYRYIHRLSRGATLEAVFPYWVRGVIRADLALRNGVELLGVTDAQINGWFTLRGISPQFVYNWQDLTGAGSAAAYPASVKFLLYAAGTWVKGGSDVITLDTIYDSVNLGTNDYTALFTEEGFLVAKLGHDSRVVTVPLKADGFAAASAVAVPAP